MKVCIKQTLTTCVCDVQMRYINNSRSTEDHTDSAFMKGMIIMF